MIWCTTMSNFWPRSTSIVMISEIVTLAVVVGVATGTDAAVKTGAATVEGTGATLAGLV